MPAGSLTVVGTGIQLVGQLTLESLRCIETADVLLYLAGNAVAARWLWKLNPNAQGLDDCYAEGKSRCVSYIEMVERILAPVREGRQVVAAFYGHPGVGVTPAHAAIARARHEGFRARMLPGISAEACLFADLGLDPVTAGYQSYEASAFVALRPQIDPRHALVLWQIALIGEDSIRFSGEPNLRGLQRLARALARHYPAQHQALCYRASWFPLCAPVIERVSVRSIPHAVVTLSTTLFVPPIPR